MLKRRLAGITWGYDFKIHLQRDEALLVEESHSGQWCPYKDSLHRLDSCAYDPLSTIIVIENPFLNKPGTAKVAAPVRKKE